MTKDDLLKEIGNNVIAFKSLAGVSPAVDEYTNAIIAQSKCCAMLPRSTETFIFLAAGRVMIKGTYDEVKDFAEKLAMPVGTVTHMVNVVEWQ